MATGDLKKALVLIGVAATSAVEGCTPRWVVGDVSSFSETATMVPARATLDGNPFGYGYYLSLDNPPTELTSCDQIAAIGVADGIVRGTSTLIDKGFSLGWLGIHSEEIEFQYYRASEDKAYYAASKYTMKAGGQLGSFAVDADGLSKAFILELLRDPPSPSPSPSPSPPCLPCASCTKYVREGTTYELYEGTTCETTNEATSPRCEFKHAGKSYGVCGNEGRSCYLPC